MTDIELAVLKALEHRYGKMCAVSRDQLRLDVSFMLDLPADQETSDRMVREAIENLRRSHPTGALIISSPSWAGYWIAEDFEEVREFADRRRNTAKKLFQDARSQINLARDQFEVLDEEPQIRMFA